MQSPTWIRARELDQWAKSPQAKVLLPELIGRLVRATVPPEQLSKCDFAAEAETHRPVFDGTTVTAQATLYVPAGIVCWELGCDAKPEQKAQSDYEKRIAEHEARVKAGEADDISQATFIAVTARDWHAKKAAVKKGHRTASKQTVGKKGKTVGGMAEWAEARTKEKRFKEVVAYDSNQLEQWIREAPAVGLWLAKEMGKAISGVLDVGSHWLDVQAALKKPLPPEVLLVNRASIAAGFKDWLAGPARELSVRAPSATELVAVFAAWVHTLPAEEANAISSRAIIVEDRDTWRALASSPHSLILIAAPQLDAERELFSGAVRKGHFVLRQADFRADARSGTVDLDRMRRFDLQQALEKGGLEDAEARQVAQAAGGNFTILRRVFANSPEVQFPAWSKDPALAALLLVGAWEDERPADREIVERLAGLPYNEARANAAKWRIESDAPLRLIAKERGDGKVWEFLSPLDAWESLRWHLNPALVAALEEVAVEVLTEDDPGLLLPPKDRPMAAIKGMVRRFSHDLGQGIAEILAIGATRQDESGIAKDVDFARHAASVVRRVLPAGCGWQRWASLGQLLSSLVEAAPDEFLSAVERDLTSADPQTVELIRQEIPPSGIGGACYHSGLLWALETAAWPREHLNRVASILAQLTERDPGGKWSNRPLGSATRIFFSWRPQTVATVGERIEALNLISREWPAATWQIVVALIPKSPGMFSDSSKPSYRDWAAGWTGEITYPDYFSFLDALADVAIRLATEAPSRWGELLDEVSSFHSASEKAYQQVRDAFEALVLGGVTAELKEPLWQKLRVLVRDHTRYQGAEWALPPAEVARWTALRDRLSPDDPVVGLAPLFIDDSWDDPDESLTYEQKRERRAVERRAAIREIWTADGVENVKRLATRSGQPWAVGWSLAEEAGDEAQASIVPAFLACGDEVLDRAGSGFAAQRIFAGGADWAEAVPEKNWSPEQTVMWAIQMPSNARTWDWVASRGETTEQLYWQRVGSWGGNDLSMVEATRAVKNFHQAGRAWDALQLLVSRKDITQPANADKLCEALEAVLADQSGRNIGTMDAHYVREALGFLQKPEAQADENRVARLEFSFLPLLDRHFLLPKTLQRQLARDPQFFVECLTLLYRARGEDGQPEEEVTGDAEEPTEQKRQLAQRIWQLLHDWSVIPGTDAEGVVSPDALRAWVTEARKLAAAAHRLEVCDIQIGGVLAKSPPDSDEGVPLVAIRNVIEECKSEDIESGFTIGLHNLRGGYSKGLYEGGKQERDLAASFERHAQICSSWPRTARALQAVSKDYVRQAEQEDERAKARE